MTVPPFRSLERPSHRPVQPFHGVPCQMATEPTTSSTPALNRSAQLETYRRAMRHMPGGTDSNFRAWGEQTIYVDRGKGGNVWDIDQNEYVDLRMGYGPVI